MKTTDQIRRGHDMLNEIMSPSRELFGVDYEFIKAITADQEVRTFTCGVLRTLCWVLDCDEGRESVQDLLDALEQELASRGYHIEEKLPFPMRRKPGEG